MKRKIGLICIIMVAILAANIMSSYAVSKSDFHWETKKVNGKYVTKFYQYNKCVCKIKTKNKIAVRMYREEELNYKDIVKRKNKYILVERIDGECLNDNGDGITSCGYYISYKNVKHKKGLKYTTFCIYKNSKAIDDIKTRVDFGLKI